MKSTTQSTGFALLCSLVFAGCSDSDPAVTGTETSTKTQAAIWADVEGETLLLEAPPAWLRGQERTTDKFRIVDFYPASNDRENWYEKLTVESNNLAPLPDPIAFVTELGEAQKKQCTSSDHQNIATAIENGYQTSVRLLICGEDKTTGRVRVTLIKAILGNDDFYTISHTKRSDPFETKQTPISKEEIGQWSLYMRSIKLCNTNDPDHPCPTQ